MTSNFYDRLEAGFPAAGGAVALETVDGRPVTYSDLDELSGRLAALLLDLGATDGERVLAAVDKSPEAICLYLACLRAGAALVPLEPALPPAELDFFIGDAEPRVVVCPPQRREEFETLLRGRDAAQLLTLAADGAGSLMDRREAFDDAGTVAVDSDDVAALLYTSGTTGRSKGAMLTHGNLASNAFALTAAWDFGPDDVLLHALPLFHVHGLFVACHCALLAGARMIFLPRFDVEQVVAGLPRATVMMGVPTYYTRLLESRSFTAETVRAMRLFVSGSAPLRPSTLRAFEERTGRVIHERYGMSETLITTATPIDGPRVPGSVGAALPGVELRVQEGELQVRGPNVFRGYFRQPEKTAAAFADDGFFSTGDLVRIDDDGAVFIVGRATNLIITGGENVYPKEVEALLDGLDGVAESAVFGVPHPDFGEAVTAAVVQSVAAEEPTAEVLIDQLRTKLARHKLPKRVLFVDELPRNAMGKVQKATLRKRYKALYED